MSHSTSLGEPVGSDKTLRGCPRDIMVPFSRRSAFCYLNFTVRMMHIEKLNYKTVFTLSDHSLHSQIIFSIYFGVSPARPLIWILL